MIHKVRTRIPKYGNSKHVSARAVWVSYSLSGDSLYESSTSGTDNAQGPPQFSAHGDRVAGTANSQQTTEQPFVIL